MQLLGKKCLNFRGGERAKAIGETPDVTLNASTLGGGKTKAVFQSYKN
jgi:hypothetical protein